MRNMLKARFFWNGRRGYLSEGACGTHLPRGMDVGGCCLETTCLSSEEFGDSEQSGKPHLGQPWVLETKWGGLPQGERWAPAPLRTSRTPVPSQTNRARPRLGVPGMPLFTSAPLWLPTRTGHARASANLGLGRPGPRQTWWCVYAVTTLATVPLFQRNSNLHRDTWGPCLLHGSWGTGGRVPLY